MTRLRRAAVEAHEFFSDIPEAEATTTVDRDILAQILEEAKAKSPALKARYDNLLSEKPMGKWEEVTRLNTVVVTWFATRWKNQRADMKRKIAGERRIPKCKQCKERLWCLNCDRDEVSFS